MLCLNHELYFPITWTSDILGESRFDICQNANHKMFRFYGGTNKSYHFAWIYPFDQIDVIENRLKKEIAKNPDFSEMDEFSYFISNWKYIIKEGFYPEHFIKTPKKAYENNLLKRTSKISSYSLEKYSELLTLEKEPYSPEPELGDKNFGEIIQKFVLEAKNRSSIIDDCKNIDRKYEEDFFNLIKDYLKSEIQEQKWLAVKALTSYAISKVKNQDKFYEIIHTCLEDKKYLIRDEIGGLMYNYSFYYPLESINLINNLIDSPNINLKLYGILFTKNFHSFFNNKESNQESTGKIFSFNKENSNIFISLFEKALDAQNDFLQILLEKKSFWQQNKKWFLNKTDNFNDLRIDEKLVEYERLLNCFTLAFEPLNDFSYF